MSGSKRRRSRERRSTGPAWPGPSSHPEPIYQITVEAHSLAYGGPETPIPSPWRHEDQWYGQDGWPPQPYWLSPLGQWYEWDEEHEVYLRLGSDDDAPRSELLLKIVNALNERAPQPLGTHVAHHVENFVPGVTTLHTLLDSEPEDTDGHRARVEGESR